MPRTQNRPGAAQTPDSRGIVVCGSDRTMLRVVTELVSSGEQVTAIVNPASRHFERIGELGAQVMGVRVVSESVLRRAGIDRRRESLRQRAPWCCSTRMTSTTSTPR